MIELNVTTPWDTDTYYELGVATSVVGGQPQMKICSVLINYDGLNIPCYEPRDQLYITTTGGPPYDQMMWDLGRIRNSAQRFTCLTICAIHLPTFAFGISTKRHIQAKTIARTLFQGFSPFHSFPSSPFSSFLSFLRSGSLKSSWGAL